MMWRGDSVGKVLGELLWGKTSLLQPLSSLEKPHHVSAEPALLFKS